MSTKTLLPPHLWEAANKASNEVGSSAVLRTASRQQRHSSHSSKGCSVVPTVSMLPTGQQRSLLIPSKALGHVILSFFELIYSLAKAPCATRGALQKQWWTKDSTRMLNAARLGRKLPAMCCRAGGMWGPVGQDELHCAPTASLREWRAPVGMHRSVLLWPLLPWTAFTDIFSILTKMKIYMESLSWSMGSGGPLTLTWFLLLSLTLTDFPVQTFLTPLKVKSKRCWALCSCNPSTTSAKSFSAVQIEMLTHFLCLSPLRKPIHCTTMFQLSQEQLKLCMPM